uniref:Uncharacterized protein n=1 Tax=Rhizophora mucronata TaxID=61149 RepID=A0A2P2N0W1_RHIMU
MLRPDAEEPSKTRSPN